MRALIGGRLRLVDSIGAGGSGTVWRAFDARDRTFVAAKLTPLTMPAEQPRLEHPHVLLPHDSWPCGVTLVHLMRLVRGGTADRLLADHGALPTAYVAVLLDQLLDALGAVHAAGFAHRDVKPANLLLEPTGAGRPHLWLGDLGAAARIRRTATTFAGTDGYVAPEVRPGSPATPAQDLYAAGVAAVELLTGRVPQHDRDLPRCRLRSLLLDLIDPDPECRAATAEDARARLHALGVPDGLPWTGAPHPPNVPDRLPRLTLAERWRLQGVRAAQ